MSWRRFSLLPRLRCPHTRADWGRPRVRCGRSLRHDGQCRAEVDGWVATWTPGDWYARYTSVDPD